MLPNTYRAKWSAEMAFIELTKNGEKFVKREEGIIPYVYDDAVYPTKRYKAGTKVKGNLTAGVGHLLSRGNNIFPEAQQWIGKDIPMAQIDRWFDADTDEAERAVSTLVKVPLEPHQRDTCISFTFNVGVGGFGGSTLLKKLNKKLYNAIPDELRKWTKTTINGKKVTSKGLVKRRANEIALWLGGRQDTPTTEMGVVASTPGGTQIAEAEKKGLDVGEVVGGVGTIAMGAGGFATATGPVAWAFFALIVAVIVLGGAVFVKRQFFDNKPKPVEV